MPLGAWMTKNCGLSIVRYGLCGVTEKYIMNPFEKSAVFL